MNNKQVPAAKYMPRMTAELIKTIMHAFTPSWDSTVQRWKNEVWLWEMRGSLMLASPLTFWKKQPTDFHLKTLRNPRQIKKSKQLIYFFCQIGFKIRSRPRCFAAPPRLPRYVLLRFHHRAKRPSFQRTFCSKLFSVTSKESGVRATGVDERPRQSGDISTLVLLDSTIQHSDAASCRVALIGSQSHVRPIREPFKRLPVYFWKLCPSKKANFIERTIV